MPGVKRTTSVASYRHGILVGRSPSLSRSQSLSLRQGLATLALLINQNVLFHRVIQSSQMVHHQRCKERGGATVFYRGVTNSLTEILRFTNVERQTSSQTYSFSPSPSPGTSSQWGNSSLTPHTTCATCCLSLNASAFPSASPGRPTIVTDESVVPLNARFFTMLMNRPMWNWSRDLRYRTSSTILGHDTRPDWFRPGSNARMKGRSSQSIKVRVRRLFMEESAWKTGHP